MKNFKFAERDNVGTMVLYRTSSFYFFINKREVYDKTNTNNKKKAIFNNSGKKNKSVMVWLK